MQTVRCFLAYTAEMSQLGLAVQDGTTIEELDVRAWVPRSPDRFIQKVYEEGDNVILEVSNLVTGQPIAKIGDLRPKIEEFDTGMPIMLKEGREVWPVEWLKYDYEKLGLVLVANAE